MLLVISIIFCVVASTTYLHPCTSPGNQAILDDFCYTRIDLNCSWLTAQSECRARYVDSDLVTIMSSPENELILSHLWRPGNVWTGGHIDRLGRCFWSDTTPWKHDAYVPEPWDPGCSVSHRCLSLRSDGLWGPQSCFDELNPVCKFPLPRCYDTSSGKRDKVCSGHGACVAEDECVCQAREDEDSDSLEVRLYGTSSHYSGNECQFHQCFGVWNAKLESDSHETHGNNPNGQVITSRPLPCSGHGSCVDYNLCSCRPPFYGPQCLEQLLPAYIEIPYSSLSSVRHLILPWDVPMTHYLVSPWSASLTERFHCRDVIVNYGVLGEGSSCKFVLSDNGARLSSLEVFLGSDDSLEEDEEKITLIVILRSSNSIALANITVDRVVVAPDPSLDETEASAAKRTGIMSVSLVAVGGSFGFVLMLGILILLCVICCKKMLHHREEKNMSLVAKTQRSWERAVVERRSKRLSCSSSSSSITRINGRNSSSSTASDNDLSVSTSRPSSLSIPPSASENQNRRISPTKTPAFGEGVPEVRRDASHFSVLPVIPKNELSSLPLDEVFGDVVRICCNDELILSKTPLSRDLVRLMKKISILEDPSFGVPPNGNYPRLPIVNASSEGDFSLFVPDNLCSSSFRSRGTALPPQNYLFGLLRAFREIFSPELEEFDAVDFLNHVNLQNLKGLDVWLVEAFGGENSRVIRILKVIQQTLVARVLHRFRDVLYKRDLRFKDSRGEWHVLVHYGRDKQTRRINRTSVVHRRREIMYHSPRRGRNRDLFRFGWEVEVHLDPEFEWMPCKMVELRLIQFAPLQGEMFQESDLHEEAKQVLIDFFESAKKKQVECVVM